MHNKPSHPSIPHYVAVLLLICSIPLMAAAESPLQFGNNPSLPLPKSLVFSITPDKVVADAPAWKAIGMDGFFLEGVASEWSSDIWATDGKLYSIGASDETYQKVRHANDVCKPLGMENFLKVVFANPLEWFNDIAWQKIDNNFRQFAIFARDTGCKGIALDIEYVGQQYAFDWSGYDYKSYTRKDLIEKIRARAKSIIDAMYDEFPDMVFLVLPDEGFNLGGHIETAWLEEAAARNAPGGIHYCLESTYNDDNIDRMFAHVAATNNLVRRQLSARAQEYWGEHCSLAAGMFPVGFGISANHDPKKTPEEVRRCWASALMVSPRYNWLYVDRYRDEQLGRNLDAYKGNMDFPACTEVLRKRETVTNAPFVAIAQRLRTLPANDKFDEIHVAPIPRFIFPYAVPQLELASDVAPEESERQWHIAMDYYNGIKQNVQEIFAPVRDWQIIGPFPSKEPLGGHDAVFPPEQGINLTAEYDGANGKVKWHPYHVQDGGLGIDLKKQYDPNQNVTAYALTYVDSPKDQEVQARFCSNDAGKLWIGGKLVDNFPHESWSVLDRDIVTVTLPKGRTPVLAKVTNGIGEWALVLRFTNKIGEPVPDLTFGTMP